MMLEVALSRPEYAPTARHTKLVDISALDYYGKGYADIPARLAFDQRTPRRETRLDPQHGTCARP